MIAKYKRYLYFNRNELLVIGSIFAIVAILTWAHRSWLLYDSKAVTITETTDFFIGQRIELPQLFSIMESKKVSFDREQVQWAGNIEGLNQTSIGHYRFPPGRYSVERFLKKIVLGHQDPVRITILPGQDIERITESLDRQLYIDSTAIAGFFADTAALKMLDITPSHLIGRLYPETYEVFWTAKPRQVMQQVVNTFNRQITENYSEQIEASSLDIHEIITLASIVEWEAQKEVEKPKIAGLYWNRLKKGWRLQADPTVNYALKERRRLTYADYEIDHPYNTYRFRGLPPGPITNPARSSIEAVLNPEDHNYMYMVATPQGTHDFSYTYEEHKRKAREWQRWIRKQYRLKRMGQ